MVLGTVFRDGVFSTPLVRIFSSVTSKDRKKSFMMLRRLVLKQSSKGHRFVQVTMAGYLRHSEMDEKVSLATGADHPSVQTKDKDCNTITQHHIETNVAAPIRQRARRLPLAKWDEAEAKIPGSTWFSALDLRSGYWQVPLSLSARPKTAFTIGRGVWEFNVMLFGLCNSPATFKRLMEKLIAKANLRLNLVKCSLFRRQTSFLGHVSERGVSEDEEVGPVLQ
ncbi:hypothetical protein AAFF_G00205020 [Aldrovandia affinis]|uniref:ribonuclease H n=1 Tax=Aldrovandia affinis TaxID=143900 RepID=A0AAD7RHS2_9TELE|nr:hypothetical protein AAFF_G00205020 [Aldrovandia affinis]